MLAEMRIRQGGVHAPIHSENKPSCFFRVKNVGKMLGKPLGWGPLKNQPLIYTPYVVGIYWVYPLLKGSLRG